jgi:hypothetical protein
MGSAIQRAVLSACRDFMRPIARLLIKNGIGYREFSDVCKATFVEVASTDHGIRGRKTNMSRVAVMTGLSRKEVKKIRDALAVGESEMILRARRPELVLSAWHSDPDFITKNGAPLRIRYDGPGPNFKNLVARVGGDIPPKAMLNELLRAGSVVQEGEKLRAVSRSYIPEANDPETILVAGNAIHDLAWTINHNLGCQDPELRFFERRVYSEKLPGTQRPRFKKLAKEKSEVFLRDLNAWLSARESAAPAGTDTGLDHSEPIPRIGVGIYFFDDLVSTDGGRDYSQ